MKKILTIAILLLAACAAPATEPEQQACCRALTATCLACSEGVSVEQYCAENPNTVGCAPVEPEPVVVPTATFDEPTQKLQIKGADSKNYQFSYAPLPENKAQRTYYVRGDKVRAELYTPALREKDSYDVVYLDLTARKAAAYCELGNPTICPDKEKVMARPDFDTYYVQLPHELISSIDNGELVGSVTYDGHVADIVESYYNGEYLRMTVNRFYGIPMKVEVYEDSTHTGEPLGQQNRDFGFNTVKEAQVTPPGGW